MPDEIFGNLIAFTDVENAILGHYKKWMDTWLSARERKLGMTVGDISRPRSYIVKQTFTALPGEESTPIVIAVSDGFGAEPVRRGDGRWDALFRLGIAVMCLGNNGSARALCGHYQTAIVGIATHNRSVTMPDGNVVKFDDLTDLRIEDIDEEAIGRSLAAVRMVVVYRVDAFTKEFPIPDLVPDPVPPQSDLPEVETVDVDVEKYLANEVIP